MYFVYGLVRIQTHYWLLLFHSNQMHEDLFFGFDCVIFFFLLVHYKRIEQQHENIGNNKISIFLLVPIFFLILDFFLSLVWLNYKNFVTKMFVDNTITAIIMRPSINKKKQKRQINSCFNNTRTYVLNEIELYL